MGEYGVYESIFAVFNTIYPLSEQLKADIIDHSSVLKVAKKQVLVREGETNHTIWFIVSGGARIYYIDQEGKETNTWFLFENELLISVYSFFTGRPGFECIETLEDCTLIALRRSHLDSLYNKHMEFNLIGRKLTEHYYIRNEEQANALRMLKARERYDKLMADNPALFHRVPLQYIASYLGMSRETLSRIRK